MSIQSLNKLWLNYEISQIQKNLGQKSSPLDALLQGASVLEFVGRQPKIVSPTTIQNVNNANSLLLTADSALNVQISIAEQMQSLAELASDPEVTGTHRSDLQNEFESLLKQFEFITNNTNYKGTKLLDGSYAAQEIYLGEGVNPSGFLTMPGFSDSSAYLESLKLPVILEIDPEGGVEINPHTPSLGGDGSSNEAQFDSGEPLSGDLPVGGDLELATTGPNLMSADNAAQTSAALTSTLNTLRSEAAQTHERLTTLSTLATNALLKPQARVNLNGGSLTSVADSIVESAQSRSSSALRLAHSSLEALIVAQLLSSEED